MKVWQSSIAGLGKMVRALRQEASMSQDILARKSRISQYSISNIETGVTKAPTLGALRRIAGVFQREVVIKFVQKSKSKENES